MREDRTPKTVLTGNKIKMPNIKMGTSREQQRRVERLCCQLMHIKN
jgi:hypothetical protein